MTGLHTILLTVVSTEADGTGISAVRYPVGQQHSVQATTAASVLQPQRSRIKLQPFGQWQQLQPFGQQHPQQLQPFGQQQLQPLYNFIFNCKKCGSCYL